LRAGMRIAAITDQSLYPPPGHSQPLGENHSQENQIQAALTDMLASSPVSPSTVAAEFDMFIQELTTPAEQASVEVGAEFMIAMAMSQGKVTKVVPAFGWPLNVLLRAPSIEHSRRGRYRRPANTQRHFVTMRKRLWRYGFANVITMRTVAAGPDCLAATTVQTPARWAGRKGNSSTQISSEPVSLHTPGWRDEVRMLGRSAPYQVCMRTATSMEAGAVTLTSNPYRAGSGAVIMYWAEERPLDSARSAACGLPMTLAAPVCCGSWLPVLLLPVQAALVVASMPHMARQARVRLTAIA
jgi:hypothetical protein